MRLVMDAYWWSRGTQSLRGAVHGLVTAWARRYPDDEIVIVTRRSDREDFESLASNVRPVVTRVWPHALSAMLVVPWMARRSRADAMFSHNFAPLFGRARSVFVHDAIFTTNPEWFTRKERAYFRWMMTSSRRADVLFSSTATEGERLRTRSHAPRVVPVGFGLSEELVSGVQDTDVTGLASGSFLLAVGRLNVRKNLWNTLEGARLSGCVTADRPMVIVGERDGQEGELPPWVEEAISDGSVRFTGFVETSTLRWLLRNCTLYLCLSLDEGFGLPPVEARALGAQVLVSDRPVFRETLGAEAHYVEPTSAPEIGLAIARLLEAGASLPVEEDLVARHSWDRTVGLIRNELLSVAKRPGGTRGRT